MLRFLFWACFTGMIFVTGYGLYSLAQLPALHAGLTDQISALIPFGTPWENQIRNARPGLVDLAISLRYFLVLGEWAAYMLGLGMLAVVLRMADSPKVDKAISPEPEKTGFKGKAIYSN